MTVVLKQEEVNESQIVVHWTEEDYFYPPADFIAQANLNDPNVDKRFSLDNFPECFNEYAELLTSYKKWDQTSTSPVTASARRSSSRPASS